MSKQQLKVGCYLYILLASQRNKLRGRELRFTYLKKKKDLHILLLYQRKKKKSMIHRMPFIYIQISSYNQIRILIKIILTVTGQSADLGHPWAPTLTDALGCFKHE